MAEDAQTARDLLKELDDTFLVLADSVPGAARSLAAAASLLGEIRGILGEGSVSAETQALIARFKGVVDNLASCLELEPTAGKSHRALLADLLALRPEAGNGYAAGAIDDLRKRARSLLVGE